MRFVSSRHWIALLISVSFFATFQIEAAADTPSPTSSASSPTSSPTPMGAVSDDKAVQARAKTWFAMLQSTKIDRSQLTKAMNDALTSDKVQMVADQLKTLGPVTSFTPIDKTVQSPYTVYRYRVGFATTALVFTFSLDPNGKIAGLYLSPANS
jgi:uncharacterized iron-regulated membrane protein